MSWNHSNTQTGFLVRSTCFTEACVSLAGSIAFNGARISGDVVQHSVEYSSLLQTDTKLLLVVLDMIPSISSVRLDMERWLPLLDRRKEKRGDLGDFVSPPPPPPPPLALSIDCVELCLWNKILMLVMVASLLGEMELKEDSKVLFSSFLSSHRRCMSEELFRWKIKKLAVGSQNAHLASLDSRLKEQNFKRGPSFGCQEQ